MTFLRISVHAIGAWINVSRLLGFLNVFMPIAHFSGMTCRFYSYAPSRQRNDSCSLDQEGAILSSSRSYYDIARVVIEVRKKMPFDTSDAATEEEQNRIRGGRRNSVAHKNAEEHRSNTMEDWIAGDCCCCPRGCMGRELLLRMPPEKTKRRARCIPDFRVT